MLVKKEFTILTQGIQHSAVHTASVYWVPRTHPPYPLEYRQQIVELALAGRSPVELAREFEPSEQTIRNWIKQAEIDTDPVRTVPCTLHRYSVLGAGQRHDGLTTVEQQDLARLRRENKQLRLEREILAKAAAWFPCHGLASAPGLGARETGSQ